jgi:hypothetical protein
LIERIVVDVMDGTERLDVTVHWSGGFTSHHETRRTVSTFDELEDSEALLRRAQQLYNSGCPRSELIARLNAEGFRSARSGKFTKSSSNSLFLVLRRKRMIGSKPAMSKPDWRSCELSRELGLAPATLTGWRHQGWLQARQLGSRWIYWADADELSRLRELAAYPTNASKPAKLTNPTSKMPDPKDSEL